MPIDFVRGDLDEAADGKLPNGFEQHVRSNHVGPQERCGIQDRSVDVSFGCEIDDDVDAVARQDLGDGALVGDVASYEVIAWRVADVREVRRVCGVGDGIKIDDANVGPFVQHGADEMRTDES